MSTPTSGSEAPTCPVPSHAPIGPDGKPLRMCCVCKDTKLVRDQCVIEKGEDKCTQEINTHKDCLRALGFKV